jgi:hypothetical protein
MYNFQDFLGACKMLHYEEKVQQRIEIAGFSF